MNLRSFHILGAFVPVLIAACSSQESSSGKWACSNVKVPSGNAVECVTTTAESVAEVTSYLCTSGDADCPDTTVDGPPLGSTSDGTGGSTGDGPFGSRPIGSVPSLSGDDDDSTNDSSNGGSTSDGTPDYCPTCWSGYPNDGDTQDGDGWDHSDSDGDGSGSGSGGNGGGGSGSGGSGSGGGDSYDGSGNNGNGGGGGSATGGGGSSGGGSGNGGGKKGNCSHSKGGGSGSGGGSSSGGGASGGGGSNGNGGNGNGGGNGKKCDAGTGGGGSSDGSGSSGGSGGGGGDSADGGSASNGGGGSGGGGGDSWTCVKDGCKRTCHKTPKCEEGTHASKCGACVPDGQSDDCTPPTEGGCWITGGGFTVEKDGSHESCGGNGMPMKDGSIRGKWTHVDHSSGNVLHGDVKYLACSKVEGAGPGNPGGKNKGFDMNQVNFGGEARWAKDEPVWFDVVARDHGEPGKTDEYTITVRRLSGNGQSGEILFQTGGTLSGGNMQIHPSNNGHPYVSSTIPTWVKQ